METQLLRPFRNSLFKIICILNLLFVLVPGFLPAQNWSQLSTTGNPTERANASSIYASSRTFFEVVIYMPSKKDETESFLGTGPFS